ncbi:putative tubulin tyrosine ligase [Trypanosoma rangeli]|uniref:Putative tubulin tyrosine ligase n=1 Tax=Trypanosoma rangeli TaxID=5698 RepID=A0A422N255_TRYRA|nr:putative tubulin tyrosine ligase [Trypanosoma rangeli]RNE99552.1 putative tubulin tyrosine ligase [Trypanosoma rangeli]|eukprot:RNE99552.1 putative tubulin tyrosine ligase [Trypanosoma rangeli]
MNSFDEFSGLLSTWFEVHGVTENLQRRLYEKLRNDVFDAGDSFSLATLAAEGCEEKVSLPQEAEEPVNNEYVLVSTRDLQAKEDIWLVDHCCTFRLREFCEHLKVNAALRERLGRILSLNLSHTNAEEDTRTVFDNMWTKVGSYRLPGRVDDGDAHYENSWYIHDEVGSAITVVTDEPGNMKLEPVPVCFPEKGGVFSAMWCVEDMEEGTIATQKAETLLETWGGKEVVELLYGMAGQESYMDAKQACLEAWRRMVGRMEAVSSTMAEQVHSIEADDARDSGHNVVDAGRRRPVAPLPTPLPESRESAELSVKLPLRVFTDSKLVSANLTDAKHFMLVDLPQEAQAVWVVHDHIDDLNKFRYAQFVSQFPEEKLFTSKKGLLQLIQDHYGYVDWYQVSYDSTSQLHEFIGDFMVRQAKLHGTAPDGVVTRDDICALHSDDGTNLWITKPTNMARSIDMTISSNLNALLRAIETGPKVVCKYVAKTATLHRRKFDLRFIVAVRSFASEETAMEAYLYNVFWTRFALEEYALNDFDHFEKHWTVMNYENPAKLIQLHDSEFIEEFNAEHAKKGYGASLWTRDVYPKIRKLLRKALDVVKVHGADRRRCRAIYGMDVMLRETLGGRPGTKSLEPTLLEINYSPDCQRACRYHPEFFNDVFRTLFTGTPVNMTPL